MKMDERTWKTVQQRLGYNDEEMRKFRENPRNPDVLAKAPALMNKTIVAKVVDSHGCNSEHKVGDNSILTVRKPDHQNFVLRNLYLCLKFNRRLNLHIE